ncbi:MAG: GDP-mannose 4,6-dehydratase [Lachnospiraceae bacterium]|nr:GDP-mannose 4,6-dehydratase [Lachnospiraceae bacterium]
MKSLIVGGAGFVGFYLTAHLLEEGEEVAITKLPGEVPHTDMAVAYDLDILNKGEIFDLLSRLRPDRIYHLAALASVALCWKNPSAAIDVNVKGAVNLMDAIREIPDYNPRILVIGSGEEYGHVRPEDIPIDEETPVRPGNIYAATKAAQGLMCGIYARAYGMDIMTVRAFNHIGPEQAPIYVVADFCRQVARIEKGLQDPVMKVGNLSAMRDFSDVRDVVRAYRLLMEHGRSKETYNVGSGKAISIEELLHMILGISKVHIDVEVDPARLRPVDVPIIEADTTKIYHDTGWKPEIPLAETIARTLDYWRRKDD